MTYPRVDIPSDAVFWSSSYLIVVQQFLKDDVFGCILLCSFDIFTIYVLALVAAICY